MKRRFAPFFAIVLATAFLFTGCGEMDPNAALVTITNNGQTDTVSLGYGNFVARYNQAVMDQYYGSYLSDNMWNEDLYGNGNTLEEDTKGNVLDQIKEEYLCKLHADDYGVTVSDEQTAAIDEAVNTFITENTEKALSAVGGSEEYAKTMLLNQTYNELVKAKIEEEAERKIEITDEEANQSTISYVLFSTDDVTTDDGDIVPLTDEEIEALKADAQELSEAEDYDKVAEDKGQTVLTYSYTTAGDASEDDVLGEDVISAAQKLKEGEVSSVIEVKDEGYYVIRKDSEFDESATESKRSALHTDKIEEYYQNKLDEWGAELTWTVDESQWKKVTFSNLFTAVYDATEDESE